MILAPGPVQERVRIQTFVLLLSGHYDVVHVEGDSQIIVRPEPSTYVIVREKLTIVLVEKFFCVPEEFLQQWSAIHEGIIFELLQN